MNFRDYVSLRDNEIQIFDDEYLYYLETDLMEAYYLSEKRTEAERKVVRSRKHALLQATDGQFNVWDNIQKAKWLAKWEFKYIGGEKGRFIKKNKPQDWKKIYLKMKKAKKLMRLKGDKIRKKAKFQLQRRYNKGKNTIIVQPQG